MVQNLIFLLKILVSAILIAKMDRALAVSNILSKTEIKTLFERQIKPHVIRGEFSQIKRIKDMGIDIKTQGFYEIRHLSAEVFLVNWNIRQPEKMRVCIDQNKIVFFNDLTGKKNTLTLSELSQGDSSGLFKLIDLIKLDPDEISAKFNLRALDPKPNRHFELEPKNATSYSFLNSKLDFDSKMNLKKILLSEKNGDSLEVQFSNIQFENLIINQIKKDQMTRECL